MRTEFGVERGPGCTCRSCRRNCMFMPGFLIPADLTRMCPDVTQAIGWAEETLEASPGALVAKAGELFRIPTLVMKAQENGYCIMFQNRRCAIWENNPFGCAFFGCDMGLRDQERLAHEGLMAVYEAWHQTPPTLYQTLWEHLKQTGRMADPPEIRRLRMAEAE